MVGCRRADYEQGLFFFLAVYHHMHAIAIINDDFPKHDRNVDELTLR